MQKNCSIVSRLPELIDSTLYLTLVQIFCLSFTLLTIGGFILADIWGFRKLSFIKSVRVSLFLYGVLWFLLIGDKKTVLVFLSISNIYFVVVSLGFFFFNFKKEPFILLSIQEFLNICVNKKQWQQFKYLLKTSYFKRLQNKDINLIWEIPLGCIFVFYLIGLCGFVFPYFQKVILCRLVFLLFYFKAYQILLLLFLGGCLLALFVWKTKIYIVKIYGKKWKVLLSKENFLRCFKEFFIVFLKNFIGSLFSFCGVLLLYHWTNTLHISQKKSYYAIYLLDYEYRHCLWENGDLNGSEPTFSTDLNLDMDLLDDCLSEIDLNFTIIEPVLLFNISDLIEHGIKIREILILLLCI